MMNIMELIKDVTDNLVDAIIQQDIEKQQKAEDNLDIIESCISAMQEVCDAAVDDSSHYRLMKAIHDYKEALK